MKNIFLALIVFGLVGGAYWYLVGYDNMREQKFQAMHECMNKSEYDKDSFERCASQIGYE